MPTQRTIHGLLLLVFLAAVGGRCAGLSAAADSGDKTVAELGHGWVYAYFTVVGLGAAILLACTVWIVVGLCGAARGGSGMHQRESLNPERADERQQEQELADNLAAVEELRSDVAVAAEVRAAVDPLVQVLEEKQATATLEIVAFGDSLQRQVVAAELAGGPGRLRHGCQRRNDAPPLRDAVARSGQGCAVDTPGLGEVDGVERAAVSAAAAKDADLVLLTVDGPLRDGEFDLLQQLSRMEKRVLVCLNKEDWYADADRQLLLGHLAVSNT